MTRPTSARASFKTCAVSTAVLILTKLGLCSLAAIPFGGLDQAECRWDCDWYQTIIAYGYDLQPSGNQDQANWAFFPLYPITVRLARLVIPNPVSAAIATSIVAFAGFALISLGYLKTTRPQSDPILWTVFIMTMPFSFYFFVPYTESLYLVLTTAAMLALNRHRALGCGLCLALATATRLTALLLVPALIIERLHYGIKSLEPDMTPREKLGVLADTALPIALAPLGLFVFMAFLWHRVGDPLAFAHVQIAWNRYLHNPLAEVWNGLDDWDWYRLAEHGEQSNSYGASVAIFGLVLAGWLLWQRRLLEAWFSISSLLLCLSSGFEGLARYTFGNPANLLAMFDLLMLIRMPAMRWLTLAVMAALQGGLVCEWFRHAHFLT